MTKIKAPRKCKHFNAELVKREKRSGYHRLSPLNRFNQAVKRLLSAILVLRSACQALNLTRKSSDFVTGPNSLAGAYTQWKKTVMVIVNAISNDIATVTQMLSAARIHRISTTEPRIATFLSSAKLMAFFV